MAPMDSALLGRWIDRRDPAAFKELTSRYAAMVLATARRILGNAAEAEDVAQECFERLACLSEGPKGHLGAWLHRVATNRAIDRIRRAQRRQAWEARFASAREVSTEIGWDDIYQHVDEVIAALPEKLRGPLVAHYLEGRTHAEIAGELGLTRQAVTRRIGRGMKAARTALGRRGIPVGSAVLAMLFGAHLAEAAPLPPALESTLGKLAVAGVKGSSAAASADAAAAMAGGFLVMKKVILGVVIVIAGVIGAWKLTGEKEEKAPGEPERKTASLPVETREETQAPAAAEGPQPGEAAPEPAGSEGEGGVITGRIFDAETGAGLPGLLAHVYPSDVPATVGDYEESDGSGRYRVSGLAPGSYLVSPQQPEGYPRMPDADQVAVTVGKCETIKGIDFALKRGVPVAGRVVLADGRPAERARVGAMLAGMPGGEHAQTEKDGSFVVYLVQAGNDLYLQAEKKALESLPLGPLMLPPDGISGLVLELTEPRAGSLAGIVVDVSGRPVEGAMVHLDRGKSNYLVGAQMATTEGGGRFTIEGLAGGEYGLIPSEPGITSWSAADEAVRVALREGQALAGLRVVLGGDKGGLAIAGRVVDTSGHPIEGARVSASGPTNQSTRTGKEGRFTITGLLDGMYYLNAIPMRETPDALEYSPVKQADVRAGARDIELVMHGKGNIEGRVVRADTGEPLPQYELFICNGTAERFRPGILMNGRQVRDPEGRFSCEIYVGPVVVTAQAPGFAPAFQNVEVREHETVEGIELHLEPVSGLQGRVVNARGEGVAGAQVFLGGASSSAEMGKAVARSAADGSFTIESISPDIRRLSAVHPDYAAGTTRIAEGSRIVLADAGAVVGMVSRDGTPLADVLVTVRFLDRSEGPRMSTRTAADGTYQASSLPPGEVEVLAKDESNRRVIREAIVESGATTKVDLAFGSATSAVVGQIKAETFGPERMLVQCEVTSAWGAESLHVDPQPDGAYRLEGVPAGHVRMSAQIWTPGLLNMKQFAEFELAEGETARQDFEFAASGRLSGRIRGLNDNMLGGVVVLEGKVPIPAAPGPDFLVRLENMYNDGVVAQAECDETGAYVAEHLLPGTYTVLALLVSKEEEEDVSLARCVSSVVEIEAGASADLDFDLR